METVGAVLAVHGRRVDKHPDAFSPNMRRVVPWRVLRSRCVDVNLSLALFRDVQDCTGSECVAFECDVKRVCIVNTLNISLQFFIGAKNWLLARRNLISQRVIQVYSFLQFLLRFHTLRIGNIIGYCIFLYFLFRR